MDTVLSIHIRKAQQNILNESFVLCIGFCVIHKPMLYVCMYASALCIKNVYVCKYVLQVVRVGVNVVCLHLDARLSMCALYVIV